MADVNGFKMDDIIDVISDSLVKIDVEEMFVLMKSVSPVKVHRPKIELMDLLSGNW